MLMTILNVVYVLLAIGMIAMILMQRGAGAQAGSGFGGGASATVFGARGASNFLSKSTKWLAIVFFGISLFMAWQASHGARPQVQQNLGVMAEQPALPATGELPAQSPSAVPAAPAPAPSAPSSVPAMPAPATPAGTEPAKTESAPAETAQPRPQTPPQGG